MTNRAIVKSAWLHSTTDDGWERSLPPKAAGRGTHSGAVINQAGENRGAPPQKTLRLKANSSPQTLIHHNSHSQLKLPAAYHTAHQGQLATPRLRCVNSDFPATSDP
ncbi:hypothetical protein KIL84_005144 [Mauremys mutica]|uniref:Uncharacterized protein n=1 Tax=Mauremys mutica TaxID=74926 RepID=A0A9D3XLD5_9SAUR|nr:hypothetical protein KIL84_005144 [Mauremys mutica]